MNQATHAQRTAEHMARESYGRLLALLAPRAQDISGAEDALADALVAALRQWPEQGVPANPEAWLLTVAQRKQIDSARRRTTAQAAQEHLATMAEEFQQGGGGNATFPDRRLALMLVCTHPQIDPALRTPLMLQILLGLTAPEIAAAYLVPPATMAQRLVRAKARIKELGLGFEEPDPETLAEQLPAAHDAIYAAFTRGWIGRKGHAEEAIWLAQCVVSLVPDSSEAKGLLALMLYLRARQDARRGPQGEYVPLDEQDVSQWDHGAFNAAETLLHAANRSGPSGRYQIEAAIQSVHCSRRNGEAPNWQAIASLYDLLFSLLPSPVVRLNRHWREAMSKAPLGRSKRSLRWNRIPGWNPTSHIGPDARNWRQRRESGRWRWKPMKLRQVWRRIRRCAPIS